MRGSANRSFHTEDSEITEKIFHSRIRVLFSQPESCGCPNQMSRSKTPVISTTGLYDFRVQTSKAFELRRKEIEVIVELGEVDRAMVERVVNGFVPSDVFDFHTHLLRGSDFNSGNRPAFAPEGVVEDAAALRAGVEAWLPGRSLRALCFGIPARGVNCESINEWVGKEVRSQPGWRALALARPTDDPKAVAALLAGGGFCGLKVYHLFAEREGSFDCDLEEFAPEWMWEILDAHSGVLMLHIVKDTAMADPVNQKAVRRLCQRYPNCKLILAHVARSFSHRHALDGLECLRDLENAWVDTSAVCESQSFTAALEILGPERILYGSDYPISNFRGRCVTVGSTFHWMHHHPEDPAAAALNQQMTLVGLESLLAFREATELYGCTAGDLQAMFCGNALKVLGEGEREEKPDWDATKAHVSCGTGLMSKRKEQFDPKTWPTYFSRCHGARVWDLDGRCFVDFAGGVGAIILGYADQEVDLAVRRRVSMGTYCTLVNPDEDHLAQTLLRLHPWAGRVRFARGGGEAMGIATRIARAATGRSGVVFCGYHGWQDWYLAANLGDNSALDGHLLPGLTPKGVPRELQGTAAPFRYNDWDSLLTAIQNVGGNPAAIIMEPMRSELPREEFVHRVKALAGDLGAVFVLDEVTSGLRFGFPGAHVRLGIEPDLAVYAKAVSNGFPFAAVVGREDVMDAANGSFISSSYWTDAVGTSAAIACLKKVERDGISPALWASGERFQQELKAVATAHPDCRMAIRGMPPSPSLSFDLGDQSTAAKVLMIRGLVERGFLASSQLYLMAAHSVDQQAQFLTALAESLAQIERELEKGCLLETAGTQAAGGTFARLA